MAIIEIRELRYLKQQIDTIPIVLEDLDKVKKIISKHVDLMRCRILFHDIIQLEIDYKNQLRDARRMYEERRNTKNS